MSGRLLAVFGLLAISTSSLGGHFAGAGAATAQKLKVTAASVGDRSLMQPTRANPIVINPKVKQQLSITVENHGADPVAVRYLRLTGSVLGVHFVRYQASANLDVPPGATRTISVPGDFFDVDGVATGYMNATMQVVDEQRNDLGSQPFVADVQGKVASSVGLLLLEASIFAIVGIIEIVVGLARRRLPGNRFVRGLLFALTAASTVIAIVVAASMGRVALFGSSTWVPIVLIASAIAFVVGYLSPGRMDREARDRAKDSEIDLVAAEAVARASGEYHSVTTGGFPQQQSGDHTGAVASHDSGGFAPPEQHTSGGFTPPEQHSSGGFTPPEQHSSGGHERVE